MNSELERANQLLDFIHQSPSEFHVVENSVAILEQHGFTRLEAGSHWALQAGGRYVVTVNGSAYIAFVVAADEAASAGFRVIQTHTDSPTIKIKPRPEMVVAEHYVKLNAEVYGGPIWNTWLDRPLSLAGRVSLRGDDAFRPRDVLVNFNRPLLCIPNLSIHHNKEVNKGVALNQQTDLLPLLGITQEDFSAEGFLVSLLAEQIGVSPEEVLDFELSMSEFERAV
jgi:aspartyl aminopeptidase